MSRRKQNILAMVLGVLLGLAIVGVTQAVEFKENLTFTWEQATADLPSLDKWRLYIRTAAGGSAIEYLDVPYVGGAGPGFTSDGQFTVTGSSGSTQRRYFVLTAWSKSGQETAPSNEVFHDFVIPWAPVTTPVNLNVTVTIRTVAPK